MIDRTTSSSWRCLEHLAREIAHISIAQAFRDDPSRELVLSAQLDGLILDYSHQRVNSRVIDAWSEFFDEIELATQVEALFTGEKINVTEGRSALHTALRQNPGDGIGGDAVENLVLIERERMLGFAEAVRGDGQFSTIVNIGIGGSDLGTATVVRALRKVGEKTPEVFFVSNIDGCAMSEVLARADPASTLFIICSKTFTTQETLSNARRARDWVIDNLGPSAVASHFAGVSVDREAMTNFGIAADRQFSFWDWVGGRFSLWSSVGLIAAIALGSQAFQDLLSGARQMDQHFRSTPWRNNLPVLMAALESWNVNFFDLSAHAVLPYSSRLSLFPSYLQQLEMESNGKSVTVDGLPVGYATSPVVWGATANDAQHSFFQLLHQGSLISSMDIILPITAPNGSVEHDWVMANAVGQIEAFTMGCPSVDPHRRHDGSRPISVLLIDQLTPDRLGSLIALYEHKVFVLSRIWRTNPFDQFGVEIGKQMARQAVKMLSPGASLEPEALRALVSVRGLVRRLRLKGDQSQ